jgi:hypothetical protein
MMKNLLSCIAYFCIFFLAKSAFVSALEVHTFDKDNITSMPFTVDEVKDAHLNFMQANYSLESLQEQITNMKRRLNFQIERFMQGKRHLILGLADNKIASVSWVSNPVKEIIFLNQSNANSIENTVQCLAKTLELFPWAEKIEFSIMEIRTAEIDFLRKIGCSENNEISPHADDPDLFHDEELFFEISTTTVRHVLKQLSQTAI